MIGPVIIARIAIAYVLSMVFYMIGTRCFNVGTPFSDSLSAKQIEIKRKSTSTRGFVFAVSFFVSLGIVLAYAPYTNFCKENNN